MGRRALPKVDAPADLSGHYLEAKSLPEPFAPEHVFGRAAPLQVEIGSGKGLFLTSAAPAMPEHDFLGIEIARKYAKFAASRLSKAEVSNAALIHGDAQLVFREHLADGSVDAVHIYFPDPWWKKRHHKRRIMNETFLKQVCRVLRPGGRLHFWTDVAAYYRASLELIAERIPLHGPFEVEESPAVHDLDYRTHFERRMRQHGKPVYRSEFSK